MYVQKIFEKSTGKTMLYFATGRRINGKNKTVYIERIGYLEDFVSKYEDPIAHFKEIAKRKNEEAKVQTYGFKYNTSDSFDFGEKATAASGQPFDSVCSYGVLPLLSLYRDLELDCFLNIRRQYRKTGYNHNHIFQMLVFGRILSPDSKLATWRERNRLLRNADFSDDDVYRSLGFFSGVKDEMTAHLNKRMCDRYGRRTTLMYYDVTNYYWEIDYDDDLRKRGVSKEHRPEPIVQMGLFMDSKGLPVTYGLFPGNTNDVVTMRPMMDRLIEGMGNENIVYVADKGMMSGMNIARIVMDHNGYVIGASVRGATDETKGYVKDQEGYTETEDGSFKYKSRIVPRKIRVQAVDGRTVEVSINERQIAFWSRKYQERARHDRDEAIGKALSRAGNGENTVLNNHAGNRFVAKAIFDSEDGKLIENPEFGYELDEGLKEREEALDGYYIIRTNVVGLRDGDKPFSDDPDAVRWHPKDGFLEMNRVLHDLDIVGIYRGLWQIERSFRITKSILKARPVFVHKRESVEAHFLSCFVALLLLRLLEKKINGSIPMESIVDSLRKANLAQIPDGNYMNLYCDRTIKELGDALGLALNKKFYSKKELSTERGKTVKK